MRFGPQMNPFHVKRPYLRGARNNCSTFVNFEPKQRWRSLRRNTTHLNNHTQPKMNTSYTRNPSTGTPQSESERLSSDLAVFLSNPALSSKLTDGSLDLASYSSTINSELAVLEKECIALHREAEPDVRVLREEMGVCDEILAGLQEMLLVSFGFILYFIVL